MPRIACNHQKLGEKHGTASPSKLPIGANPAETLTVNFRPCELWENKCLFYATQFVSICCGSPRKLLWAGTDNLRAQRRGKVWTGDTNLHVRALQAVFRAMKWSLERERRRQVRSPGAPTVRVWTDGKDQVRSVASEERGQAWEWQRFPYEDSDVHRNIVRKRSLFSSCSSVVCHCISQAQPQDLRRQREVFPPHTI